MARKAELEAEERIVESIERSRNAERAAAEADLRRIAIEEKLADRHASHAQVHAFRDRLCNFVGRSIRVEAIQEREAWAFCEDLKGALDLLNPLYGEYDPKGPSGVRLWATEGDPLGEALSSGLFETGILK